MKKKKLLPRLIFAAAAAAAICSIAVIRAHCSDPSADACRAFLKGYGWETDAEPTEVCEVFIPSEFDMVYTNYNILQKEAGLDLLPYRGMRGVRYSFTVTNYPVDAGEPVYADVLTVDGTPVAGDIMTVSIDGFMHSLMMPRL